VFSSRALVHTEAAFSADWLIIILIDVYKAADAYNEGQY